MSRRRSPAAATALCVCLSLCLSLAVPSPASAAPEFVAEIRLFEITQPDGLRRAVPAVEQAQAAHVFYDYRSASSHTGYEQRLRSILFLHRDLNTDAVSLIITHGIDAPGNQPSGRVTMDLEGVPEVARVTQSDDSGEFNINRALEGSWTYANNTDGGVVSDLPLDEDWAITITPNFVRGNTSWAYHFADGTLILLDMDLPVTIRSRGESQQGDTLEAFEGDLVTVCAFVSDPDADELDYTINWGDGGDASQGATDPDQLFCEDHIFRDDGVYGVVITVLNEAGERAAKRIEASIVNVPPTADAGGPYEAEEGQAVDLLATVVADPGLDDTHEARWDLNGDGVFDTPWDDDLGRALAFPDDCECTINLEIRDDDGGVGEAQASATVTNVPPRIVSQMPLQAVVGEPFRYVGQAVDPGDDVLTWGLDAAPARMEITPEGVIGWVPGLGDIGEQSFVLLVDDGDGGTDALEERVNVIACGAEGGPEEPGDACATGLPGECAWGQEACVDGVKVCDPVVAMAPERCNGLDDDCDGRIDEDVRNDCGLCGDVDAETCNGVDDDCNGLVDDRSGCPGGQECVGGACRGGCQAGECPDGLICVDAICVGLCDLAQCEPGTVCSEASGDCVDLCEGVACPGGEACDPATGGCVDDSCVTLGCDDGQACVDGICVEDPCGEVECPPGDFCRVGECIGSCAEVSCAAFERCRDGRCEPDPCPPTGCDEAVCADVVCPVGQLCDGGACRGDPCTAIACPRGQVCDDGQCVGDAAVLPDPSGPDEEGGDGPPGDPPPGVDPSEAEPGLGDDGQGGGELDGQGGGVGDDGPAEDPDAELPTDSCGNCALSTRSVRIPLRR